RRPVLLLGRMRRRDVALVAEEASRLRRRPHPVVEGVQRPWQGLAQQGRDRLVGRAARAQAHEIEATLDALAGHDADTWLAGRGGPLLMTRKVSNRLSGR